MSPSRGSPPIGTLFSACIVLPISSTFLHHDKSMKEPQQLAGRLRLRIHGPIYYPRSLFFPSSKSRLLLPSPPLPLNWRLRRAHPPPFRYGGRSPSFFLHSFHSHPHQRPSSCPLLKSRCRAADDSIWFCFKVHVSLVSPLPPLLSLFLLDRWATFDSPDRA